jgi:hypothetical protein
MDGTFFTLKLIIFFSPPQSPVPACKLRPEMFQCNLSGDWIAKCRSLRMQVITMNVAAGKLWILGAQNTHDVSLRPVPDVVGK